MMSVGAGLISDDIVRLRAGPNAPIAERPPQATGPLEIEARGFAILETAPAPPAPVAVVVDLSRTETNRLPAPKNVKIGHFSVPQFHKVETAAFPDYVLHYLSQNPIVTT